jgi:glycosyltransferase involved in cell wall biosynthesis
MELGSKVILQEAVFNPSDYQKEFDIFLMTSREDPFPLVNIECALQEVPIIGFRKSGGSEELLSNSGGILVEYRDINAMIEKIFELIMNEKDRIKSGKMLKKYVKENLDLTRSYESLFDNIKSIINR